MNVMSDSANTKATTTPMRPGRKSRGSPPLEYNKLDAATLRIVRQGLTVRKLWSWEEFAFAERRLLLRSRLAWRLPSSTTFLSPRVRGAPFWRVGLAVDVTCHGNRSASE